MKAPKKIYFPQSVNRKHYSIENVSFKRNHIEYIRIDAFIEKAEKWFEKQNEWFDPNGNRHCDMESFEDFVNYMKEE